MKLGGDISLPSSWSNSYNLLTAVVQHSRLDFIEVGPNFAPPPPPEQDGFANPQPNRLFFSFFQLTSHSNLISTMSPDHIITIINFRAKSNHKLNK